MDYEKDITIDESALDVEWLEQPRLMMKYTKYMSRIERDMDLAKENVDLVKAEIDKEVRTNPESYGIMKVSEGAINNIVIMQTGYKKAMREYVDIKYEYKIASGAVRAVDQRKTALENLVKLHGQQYFAGPSIPRDLTEEWQRRENEKRTDARVAEKLRRRKQ